MKKIYIIAIVVDFIIILGLGIWCFNLSKNIKENNIYWKVMIENSPKEVQDFFYAEVEKRK